MARPTIASLEEGDRFGIRECTRILRKQLRRADHTLSRTKIDSDKAGPLVELIAKINDLLRSNEKHTADLLRDPPKRKPPVSAASKS